jgi:hypothetical protein
VGDACALLVAAAAIAAASCGEEDEGDDHDDHDHHDAFKRLSRTCSTRVSLSPTTRSSTWLATKRVRQASSD